MHGLEKLRPMALLLLRIGLGAIFIHNGYPKFVGRRLEHIDEMVHINHLPAYFVYIAGVLELGGGAMLVAGLFTRMLGLLLAGEMAVAMWKGEQFFQNPLAVDKYELALWVWVRSHSRLSEQAPFLSTACFSEGENRRAEPNPKAEHSLRSGSAGPTATAFRIFRLSRRYSCS
jgi:uncharacterized membrane protein YphA (DoxX/SURF4 family)